MPEERHPSARQFTWGPPDCASQTQLCWATVLPLAASTRAWSHQFTHPTSSSLCHTSRIFRQLTATSSPCTSSSPWPHQMPVYVIRMPSCPRLPKAPPRPAFEAFLPGPYPCFILSHQEPHTDFRHPRLSSAAVWQRCPLADLGVLLHLFEAQAHMPLTLGLPILPKIPCHLELISWSQQRSEQEPGEPGAG